MQTSAKQATNYARMHPSIEPFDQRILDVGDGHRVYVEQCGNPDGVPVVVLHGGPGGGCSPTMRRFFDPSIYRIILFDQRGCGKSKPHASVDSNTTWHLVADIELIRAMCDVDRWIIFGGSWGSTLALIYAQTHPDRVAFLALRGIFLMTKAEVNWFYGGGAGAFWPEHWQSFVDPIPAQERGDLVAAYHKRLFSDDINVQADFARTWANWETALAFHDPPERRGDSPTHYARAFSRLENHYFTHDGFLPEDGHILANMELISDIPGTIVQGRYDMICPPKSAFEIARVWPAGQLMIVPSAGHALTEAGIAAGLLHTMDTLAQRFSDLGLS